MAYAYPTQGFSGPSAGGPAPIDFANEVDDMLDDDELANQDIGYMSRDKILFCIDGSQSMQTPLPDSSSPLDPLGAENLNAEGESMDTSGKGKSPLHIALESVLGVMRGKILSGPSDFVGVLIYNVQTTPPSATQDPTTQILQTPSLYLYLPLRQIGADEIKLLSQLIESANLSLAAQSSDEEERIQPEVLGDLMRPVEEGRGVDIADALEGCLHAFRDAGAKLPGNKRIFWMTNNDRPDRPSPSGLAGTGAGAGRFDTRGPARTRYMDLLSLGVEVDPFFISTGEEGFDDEFYWNDILNRSSQDSSQLDVDPSNLPAVKVDSIDGLSKLKDLMQEQVYRTSSKRVLLNAPLRFGGKDGDIVISVNGYSVISSMKKPTTKLYDLSGRQPVEAFSRTHYTATATGDRLDTSEIGYAYNFGKSDAPTTLVNPPWQARMNEYYDEHGGPDTAVGDEGEITEPEDEDDEEGSGKVKKGSASRAEAGGEKKIQTRVALTTKEIKEYKTLGLDPQIKIIGFMNPKNVRFELNVKNSIFLYPDEKTYSGSTRAFAALLAACLNRDKCALAFAYTRRNSTPYYAALMPQAEEQLEGGGQARPPGFHLIPLPFADDLRAKPEKISKTMQLCNEEQVEAMGAVVRKLRLKQSSYEPRAYPNPGLNYFFAQLQALAFEEEFKPERTIDKTLPLLDGMHQHGGQALTAFNASLQADDRVVIPVTKPVKGKRSRDDADVDREDEGVTDAYMEEAWRTGNITKMTVALLKSYAKRVGVQPEGKALKADWISIISQHLEEKLGEVKPTKKARMK